MSEIRERIIHAGQQGKATIGYACAASEQAIAVAAAAEVLRVVRERIQLQSYVAYQTPEGVIDALLSEIEHGPQIEKKEDGPALKEPDVAETEPRLTEVVSVEQAFQAYDAAVYDVFAWTATHKRPWDDSNKALGNALRQAHHAIIAAVRAELRHSGEPTR